MNRLAIVLSHPTQYYSPWFRWLAKHTQLDLKVFYLWDSGVTAKLDLKFGQTISWDVDLLSGYEHEFITNRAKRPGTGHFLGLHNPSLRDKLKSWKPDAILLFGYAYRTHLNLILRPPAPLIFRGDSHLLAQSNPSGVKRFLLQLLYKRFSAITYVGQANRAYFEAFQVPAKRLYFVPHCVNAEHFKTTPQHQNAATELREKLGVSQKRVILFAGKLIPSKQPLQLLQAFLTVASTDDALVITGDGEEKAALEKLAAAHPDHHVHFLPFANQSEMPSRYLMADIFVLPSKGNYETWGLAINEAMHMGIPCLVSNRVGCQQDLVIEGDTGWVFSHDEPTGLERSLQRALKGVASDTTLLKQRIAERIANYTYEKAAHGLAHTFDQVTADQSTSP